MEIGDAYALVQPLPDTLRSILLNCLKEFDAHQGIFRVLNYGMVESIGRCKTNYEEMVQEAEDKENDQDDSKDEEHEQEK